MTSRALIIGGSGQIGRASAISLRDAGYDVTISHRSESVELPGLEGVAALSFDREDTERLKKAAVGVDVIVDTVAYTPAHAQQLGQVAADSASLIVISTGSVYLGSNGTHFGRFDETSGPPVFPVPLTETSATITVDDGTYGATKAAMERALLEDPGVRASILRPGAVHGPYSPKLREWYFIRRVLDGRSAFVLPRSGRAQFSTSSTANIAALVLACARTPGSRVLNAVDDEQTTLEQKARTVLEVLGHTAEIFTFDGPPTDDLPPDPWDTPFPFVNSMDAARDQVGYTAPLTYAEAVAVDVDWLMGALADRHWTELFPSVVQRYGVEGWFPYAAEDSWLERHV